MSPTNITMPLFSFFSASLWRFHIYVLSLSTLPNLFFCHLPAPPASAAVYFSSMAGHAVQRGHNVARRREIIAYYLAMLSWYAMRFLSDARPLMRDDYFLDDGMMIFLRAPLHYATLQWSRIIRRKSSYDILTISACSIRAWFIHADMIFPGCKAPHRYYCLRYAFAPEDISIEGHFCAAMARARLSPRLRMIFIAAPPLAAAIFSQEFHWA